MLRGMHTAILASSRFMIIATHTLAHEPAPQARRVILTCVSLGLGPDDRALVEMMPQLPDTASLSQTDEQKLMHYINVYDRN